MSDFKAQVKAGISFLDGHYGDDSWREKINLDTLNLGSCAVCVLGQLFGDYDTGLDLTDITDRKAYDLGFNTQDDMSGLTQAWKDALGKNNVLVEVGDVYEDRYGYALKVLRTEVVTLDDGDVITVYVVQTGSVDSKGVFKGYKDSSGRPELSAVTKKMFEEGGTYPTKVEKLKLKPGMFVETADGRKWFVYSEYEVRELKDGEWAIDSSDVDWSGAKVMMTGPGSTFGKSIKRVLDGADESTI